MLRRRIESAGIAHMGAMVRREDCVAEAEAVQVYGGIVKVCGEASMAALISGMRVESHCCQLMLRFKLGLALSSGVLCLKLQVAAEHARILDKGSDLRDLTTVCPNQVACLPKKHHIIIDRLRTTFATTPPCVILSHVH